METTNLSTIAKVASPIGVSESTGMNIYESYLAPSGFNYFVGAREAGDLIILEKVAEGTTRTYLCGVLIYSKTDNVLLKEIDVPRNVDYSRHKVMQLVKEHLLEVLYEASSKEGVEIDTRQADIFVENMLDRCYFEASRKAILDWAEQVGIIS